MSQGNTLSRRAFIKGSAAVGATLATAGLLAAPHPVVAASVPDKWDQEAEVVVVGGGGAAAAAAIQAKELGADVLMLEKMDKLGGATSICGGVIMAAGTATQKAAGIADTPDEMVKYLMASAKGMADADVVKTWAYKSGETIDWLTKLGCEFPPDRLYHSGAEQEPEFTAVTPAKPRGHAQKPDSGSQVQNTGYIIFRVLEKVIKERGIRVLLQTKGTELITNATGEVVGVKAESKGQTLSIKAKKGVILAAGGFAANREMRKRHEWYGDRYMTAGMPFDTGEVILMGQAIGADIMNMGSSHGSFGGPITVGKVIEARTPGAKRYPSIFVNRRGKRFVNEDYHSPSTLTDACRRQDGFIVYQVFDEDTRKKSEPILDAYVKKMLSAPTLKELAQKAGIDAAGLEETIANWNKFAEQGQDPEFLKTGGAVGPIKAGPFYAFLVTETPISIATLGGLRINTKAQVLDTKGKPIPRLYAAGRTSGGGIGRLYAGSGTAVGEAMCMGRIAAETIVSEKPLT